ncbi:MAG: nucleotidyltransferase [Chitinophagaceae bacterium]|jgi:choline kinase|nr:nucleotidyltransferase [Chitinophagaceae bacterium]
MKPTLMILAAGMASRYGSMKQTEGFGPHGETIMDYSIYDAIRAGFGKVVFIIRKDFAENFKATFEPKLRGKIEVEYVFQEMDSFTEGFTVPSERSKPWGTAHAVLCAKDVVDEPFAVINADDFYGRNAFEKAYEFLTKECDEKTYSLIGYELNKTLSEHGTVSRGVCDVDDKENLVTITERTKIYKEGNDIIFEDNGEKRKVAFDSKVSMNFWCFHSSVFELTEKLFHQFLTDHINEPKSEFFIPIVADHFIKEEGGVIKVISTSSQWFGVTYKEDAPVVAKSLQQLIDKGDYPQSLWQ